MKRIVIILLFSIISSLAFTQESDGYIRALDAQDTISRIVFLDSVFMTEQALRKVGASNTKQEWNSNIRGCKTVFRVVDYRAKFASQELASGFLNTHLAAQTKDQQEYKGFRYKNKNIIDFKVFEEVDGKKLEHLNRKQFNIFFVMDTYFVNLVIVCYNKLSAFDLHKYIEQVVSNINSTR